MTEPIADTAETVAPVTDDLDLEKLLADFDQATQSPVQQPAPVDHAALQTKALQDSVQASIENMRLGEREAELQARQNALESEQNQRDAAEAYTTVRGDLDERYFSNELIDAWITSRAVQDKDNRIQQAWLDRASNPRAYRAVLDRLASEFQETYRRLPDPEATADRNAVAQAVRGSALATPGPEPAPNFSIMSEAEFIRWKFENMKP